MKGQFSWGNIGHRGILNPNYMGGGVKLCKAIQKKFNKKNIPVLCCVSQDKHPSFKSYFCLLMGGAEQRHG